MNLPASALKEVTLQRLRLGLQQAVGLQALAFCRNHVEMDARIDDMARTLIVRLETYILSSLDVERVDVDARWPETWWDAFKERWAPAWFTRRWPVKYHTISVHRVIQKRLCPHLDIKTHQEHLRFLMTPTE